jgi:hypothetical protein
MYFLIVGGKDVRCVIAAERLVAFAAKKREVIYSQQRVANLANLLKPHAGKDVGRAWFLKGPVSEILVLPG